MRPRLIAVDDADTSETTTTPPLASMRPRLIAVDDGDNAGEELDCIPKLQGGHGGSPWMTAPVEPLR